MTPTQSSVEHIQLPARCQAGTAAGLDWSTPSSGGASFACNGTLQNNAVMVFPPSSASEAYTRVVLPARFSGTIDAEFKYSVTATGNISLSVDKQCFANGSSPSSVDYAFTAAEAQTITVNDTNRHTLSFSS